MLAFDGERVKMPVFVQLIVVTGSQMKHLCDLQNEKNQFHKSVSIDSMKGKDKDNQFTIKMNIE